MYQQFRFEGDIHQTLECVPLAVRRKLDLAALKISLAGWQSLTHSERLSLCHLPVDSADDLGVYRDVLRAFAHRAGAELKPLDSADPSAWSSHSVPDSLRARVTLEQWRGLGEEERYAAVKLADPKRTPEKLLALLAELGIGEGPVMPTNSIQCGAKP